MSTTLAGRTAEQLRDALAAGTTRGEGIGGRAVELDVDGTLVFAKRVPLTDLELRMQSTANLYDLPTFYQYGLGSAGFGAWRELAAHTLTTTWVLAGDHGGFPLMYHWRVLPDSPPEGFLDEFGGLEPAVARWDGSPAVRARLTAIARSSASVVIFLEHVPWNLAEWLRTQHGPSAWIEEALVRTTSFMREREFVHFDVHFGNVLTDGERLYFADFGLALSRTFDLSPVEEAFLANHRWYDRACAASYLCRAMPGTATERHAALAHLVDRFHQQLVHESKQTPFPAAEAEQCS